MSPHASRVLLIKGVANYDHVRSFVDYLRRGFEEAGADARIVDLARGAPSPESWAAMEAFGPDMVLSFNLEGAKLRDPQGRPLGLGRVPLTTWMVDEPYYHPGWAPLLREPHVKTLWTNPETLAHAKAMGLRDARELRLAARTLPRVRDADRRIELLFVGSIADPVAMRARWRTQLGEGSLALLEDLREDWIADTSRPIRQVFAKVAADHGVAGHPSLAQLEPVACGEVNRWTRAKRRLDVVRAMRGLPLTVLGDGWSELLGDTPGFRFGSSLPFHLYEETVSDAKVTLAVQPIHGHGVSERYFVAMANRSALVVNDNGWLAENYRPGEEYAPFPLLEPEAARACLERLLADDDVREAMTEAAYTRTVPAHTWGARARTLLETLRKPAATRPKKRRGRRSRARAR